MTQKPKLKCNVPTCSSTNNHHSMGFCEMKVFDFSMRFAWSVCTLAFRKFIMKIMKIFIQSVIWQTAWNNIINKMYSSTKSTVKTFRWLEIPTVGEMKWLESIKSIFTWFLFYVLSCSRSLADWWLSRNLTDKKMFAFRMQKPNIYWFVEFAFTFAWMNWNKNDFNRLSHATQL